MFRKSQLRYYQRCIHRTPTNLQKNIKSQDTSTEFFMDEASHIAMLRRRQKICPHLFLIKGVYNGPSKNNNNNSTSSSSSPSSSSAILNSLSISNLFKGSESKGATTTNNTERTCTTDDDNDKLPKAIEQQCEWCGMCRTLDAATLESDYYRERLFKNLFPEVKDDEEPWVDVSYNIHSALKSLDLHVKGSDDGSTSLVTRFLAAATEQVSRRAIYQQAELRKRLKQKEEEEMKVQEEKDLDIDKEDTCHKSEIDTNCSSKSNNTASRSTGATSSDDLKSAVKDLNRESSKTEATEDFEDYADYAFAVPNKNVISPEHLYSFVPNFKNIVSRVPLTPFPQHVASIPQAMKYFSSVSRREALANYLVSQMEKEFEPNKKEEKEASTGGLSTSYDEASQVIDEPPTEFVKSALRAMKYCAVVYGTAYERHFFDSVLQVGRVRSFLEIYQSSFDSNLAAARRMVCSHLGEMNKKNNNAVWNVERQKYLKNVPAVEILSGQWTNVPWGITHVIAVDHAHKEITIAFRGTFADAGIVVDIHNGPLSLLTFEEEERLKMGPFAPKEEQLARANRSNEEQVDELKKQSRKVLRDPTVHYTAPFGFSFNIKPGSPHTQPIDKEIILLALLQYPDYKVIATGHSLGAAYASNFFASRLLIGALAKEAKLYDTPFWEDFRSAILERQAYDFKHKRSHRPSSNEKLRDLLAKIDFDDPIAVAGLYMNGFIQIKTDENGKDKNDCGSNGIPPFSSTLESRIVVNSFAPPPSANISWRNALLEYYPKLDFRAFIHDTDIIARLQVPALRLMQTTVNDVLPSTLKKTVNSIIYQAKKVAEGEKSNAVADEAVNTILDRHFRAEIAKRREIFSQSTARSVQNAKQVCSAENANREADEENTPSTEKDDEISKYSKETEQRYAKAFSTKDTNPKPLPIIATSPEEQLENLESLQTCFHDPSVPRAETRDNYWVPLGNIYLLAREGQMYHRTPKRMEWVPSEDALDAIKELFTPKNTASEDLTENDPPPLFDISDASFDIATEFNSIRKPATMALIKDPLRPTLFVPIIDQRSIHNHFLFRYGRALLDLGAKER